MHYKLFRDAFGKNCSRCKQYKVFEDYSMHTASADRKQSQCKQCFAERARLFRKGSPCVRCGSPKEHGVPQGAKLCIECSKVCSTCGVNPRDKHRTQCKACIVAADKIRSQLPERQYCQRIARIVGKYKVDRNEAVRLEATKTCEVCAKTFTRPGDRQWITATPLVKFAAFCASTVMERWGT
jgi:hypothetical protein